MPRKSVKRGNGATRSPFSNPQNAMSEKITPPAAPTPFRFKQFELQQDQCSMKIGTDGVLLGAWANTEGADSALDIGTGSGVIALMLAQRMPSAEVFGIDIDALSCEQARQNAAASPFAGRVHIVAEAIQDYARSAGRVFDLIVSNPPFFSGGTFSNREDRNQVRHTVKLPHGDLLVAARRLLSDQGRLCVVLPYLEGLRFQERAEEYNLYCRHCTEVRTVPAKPTERLLMQFEREQGRCRTDELVVRLGPAETDYTPEYKALTQDFYLKF